MANLPCLSKVHRRVKYTAYHTLNQILSLHLDWFSIKDQIYICDVINNFWVSLLYKAKGFHNVIK